MRIIGVIDLLAGRAVHAVAGVRQHYLPVRGPADEHGNETIPPGNAVALATWYRDRVGVLELYCADLDAIAGRPWQDDLIAGLANLGLPLWLDAGASSVAHAQQAAAVGAAHVVVGLETLPSFATLDDICNTVGRSRVAFSVDLRHGQPIGTPPISAPPLGTGSPDADPLDEVSLGRTAGLAGATPESVAARAAQAGVGSVIVLDLARVGTGTGLDFEMIARVRKSVPDVALLAGGGVRDATDLRRLTDAGCDGALVATALHDGRLSAVDIAALRGT